MHRLIKTLGIILFLGISCISGVENNGKQVEEVSIIKPKGEVFFNLDAESVYSNMLVKYYKDGAAEYFSFLNEHNNTIYIYEYPYPDIFRTVTLPKESGKIIGYDFADKQVLNIITRRNILCSYNLTSGASAFQYFKTDELKWYSPHVRTPHSFFSIEGKYYWPNVVLGVNDNLLMNTLSRNSVEIIQLMNYPSEVSKSSKILFENLYEFYYTYDKKRGKFIFSFPFSQELIISDKDFTKFERISASSSSVIVKPVFHKNWDDDETVQKLRFETPYYYSILVDEFNGIYYRVLVNSVSADKDYSKLDFHDKDIWLLKLNDQFEKVEENRLDKGKYAIYVSFVSTKGLNICNRGNSIKDESKIYFDIF